MLAAYHVDHTSRTAWVSHVLVHSEYRGRGIGRALWERFWAEVERSQLDCVGLAVEPELPVRRLYETRMRALDSSVSHLWDRVYWVGQVSLDALGSLEVFLMLNYCTQLKF